MAGVITKEFRGSEFKFQSTPALPKLMDEIFADNYHVLEWVDAGKLSFSPGDVILDLGANEGLFSILMAKLFPGVRVIALEPVGRTFETLKANLLLNGVNVEAVNKGVGKEEGTVVMSVSKDYSGGSSSYLTWNPENEVQIKANVIGLDELLWKSFISGGVKLMKMDVEGAEYDALYNSTILPLVDYFVGEFHMNNILTYQTRRMESLAVWVGNQTKVIHIEPCRMGE